MARTRTRSQEQSDENNEQEVAVVSDSRRRRRGVESEASTQTPATRKDRPTPSARQIKPRGGPSVGLLSRIPVVRNIALYFRGVASELQKVTWPTREEAIRLTTVVLAVTVAFSIGLGILDAFLAWWFRQAFNRDSEIIFLAIALAAAVISGGVYSVFRKRI